MIETDVIFNTQNEKIEESVGRKFEEAIKAIEPCEDDEEFIGPKLPRKMTEEEMQEFYKEMMDKFKFTILMLRFGSHAMFFVYLKYIPLQFIFIFYLQL